MLARVFTAGTGGLGLASLYLYQQGRTGFAKDADSPTPTTPSATSELLNPVEDKEVVTLYQYEMCPFCCKVKAYLDYNKIPYRTVEVDPLRKTEIQWSTYKKVPQAIVGGELVTDSSNIIKTLLTRERFPPLPEITSSTPSSSSSSSNSSKTGGGGGGWWPFSSKSSSSGSSALTTSTTSKEPRSLMPNEQVWFEWVDTNLVHSLTANIYRTPSEALQAFDYITTTGNFSTMNAALIKYSGAASMYAISNLRIKKRHNIENEREHLYQSLGTWLGAVGEKKFHGGDRPDLADIAVFGVLRSIRGLETDKDMKANTGINPWYERMTEAVGESSRLPISIVPSPDFRANLSRVPVKDL